MNTSTELGSLFKRSSSFGLSSSLTVDLSAECVRKREQSRNEAAVFLINDVKRGVPRGNYGKDYRRKGKEAIVNVG